MAKVVAIGGGVREGRGPGQAFAMVQGRAGLRRAKLGAAPFSRRPDKGQQVWTAFSADSDNFAPSTAGFMINLVVDDLDGRPRQGGGGGRDAAEDRGSERIRPFRLDHGPGGG